MGLMDMFSQGTGIAGNVDKATGGAMSSAADSLIGDVVDAFGGAAEGIGDGFGLPGVGSAAAGFVGLLIGAGETIAGWFGYNPLSDSDHLRMDIDNILKATANKPKPVDFYQYFRDDNRAQHFGQGEICLGAAGTVLGEAGGDQVLALFKKEFPDLFTIKSCRDLVLGIMTASFYGRNDPPDQWMFNLWAACANAWYAAGLRYGLWALIVNCIRPTIGNDKAIQSAVYHFDPAEYPKVAQLVGWKGQPLPYVPLTQADLHKDPPTTRLKQLAGAFWKAHAGLIVVGGLVVLAGGGTALYFVFRKRPRKETAS